MLRLALLAAAAGLLLQVERLAPFAATPIDVVDRMLILAGVTRDDVVMDLGSGDGRIPIRAAVKYGARGIGVEIDPRRIEESRANAKAAGVQHLTEFRMDDALTTDLSAATVVTLYLHWDANARLRPRLFKELKPGARIVSHGFSMGPDVPADKIDRFTNTSGDAVTLYLWRVGQRRVNVQTPNSKLQNP